MTTLYEITSEYREALAELAEADLPEDAIRDTLDGLDGEFADKCRAVAAMIRNIEADSEIIKIEAARLQKRAKTRQNRADWLRRYLVEQMQALDKSTLDDPILPLRLVQNPGTVEIVDPGAVPDEYMRTKTTIEPHKPSIKQALADGLNANWCRLVRGWRVKIG